MIMAGRTTSELYVLTHGRLHPGVMLVDQRMSLYDASCFVNML
jgi:hypothetical protein